MNYALASAIRGGVREDRILNLMSAQDLITWAASVRED